MRRADSARTSRRPSSSARKPSLSWRAARAIARASGASVWTSTGPPASPPAGPAGELGDQGEGPLLGAEVGKRSVPSGQAPRRAPRPGSRGPSPPSGCPTRTPPGAASKLFRRTAPAPFSGRRPRRAGRPGSRSGPPARRSQLVLEALGARPVPGHGGRAAVRGSATGNGLPMPAVMTRHEQAHGCDAAPAPHRSWGYSSGPFRQVAAREKVRPTAAVEQDDPLALGSAQIGQRHLGARGEAGDVRPLMSRISTWVVGADRHGQAIAGC